MNFKDLGVNERTEEVLRNMDIVKPTPVQEKAIPIALEGKNIMAQSKTGTGKTLAFVLPIVERLTGKNNEAIILTPTRELAKQVNRVVKSLKHPEVKSMTIYGGVSINNQIRKLEKGVNIIVGTPGRIIDLYKRRKLKFNNINYVVLDEGDRLWDMGFAPDIKYILNAISKSTNGSSFQFLLFSATLDADMRALVKRSTGNEFEFLNLSRDQLTVQNTYQFYYLIDFFEQKFKTFMRVLKRERPESALIFVNTKKTGNWLFNKLKRRRNFPYKVGLISGNLSQHAREQILAKYRKDRIDLLIATDVAARGLDIDDISHVFNYDVPKYPDVYVHRIGRTSRMNKKGVAITMCLKDEYEYLCKIEGLIEKELILKELESHKPKFNEEGRRFHNPFF